MAKVIVIDDVPGVRRSIAALLSRAGHDVSEAPDGAAGVDAARQTRPDVALVDMLMPEQDGIETLDILKSQRLAGSCVAMSGGGSLVGADDALAYAAPLADAVMRKPFESQDLIDLVNRLASEGEAA
jgi:CheY-like chemotaxis protein